MKNEYNMLREVKRLKSIRGYGTELVSIYVPAGFSIDMEIAKLRDEHSQSGNIKSKSTWQNVQGAIDKIIQYLRLFRVTPKNGIAVFAGNISDNQSKSDIQLFSIEPPEPLGVNIYRCDSTFMLEPIEAIIDNKDTYCMVVMDGREATIATLRGTHIQVIRKLNSLAHAKVRKGGQSAQRFQRGREESIHEYSVRISEVVNELFARNGFKIRGVLVGGPGPAKEGFVKSNTLNYQIKILGVYDTGYTDEFGLQEIVDKADDFLKEQEAAKERRVIERFMQERVRRGLAVYGYEETKKALDAKKVETLIIGSELEIHKITYKCSACNSTFDAIEMGSQRQEKHTDGGRLDVLSAEDAIEGLIELAEASGAEIVFVSDESSYGKEFNMGYSGIGAILRYK